MEVDELNWNLISWFDVVGLFVVSAFLESLRPPGSPLVKSTDLSFHDGLDPASSGCDPDALKGVSLDAIDIQSLDIETERVKVRRSVQGSSSDPFHASDPCNGSWRCWMFLPFRWVQDRSAYEKFLKINVRHITDGQGVVAGVLLVTPNTVMFDPNVSDPLVNSHFNSSFIIDLNVSFIPSTLNGALVTSDTSTALVTVLWFWFFNWISF